MKFRRLLVPHDFSTHADTALKAAVALVPGGRVTILHVISPAEIMPDASFGAPIVYVDPTESIEQARQALQRRASKYAKAKHAPRFDCKVEMGIPYLSIVEAGKKADAIVMSTAGRTGLAHLLIGSVAERVVQHATVPVLTIRPKPAAARRKRSTRR